MNTDELNGDNLVNDTASQRAVSIYGQDDGVEDFPVLKAFQQYIDAEQEKARKRVLNLGIFFGVLLILVIAVFMILLHGINSRNQQLSDRLVEYAMNESARHPPVTQVPAPSNNDATIKAMTDTLVTLQKQMLEAKRETETAKSVPDRQAQIEEEKLKRTEALLAAEKQRLAVEKERLHQIEIEQQRRKLYPELYRNSENDEYAPYGTRRAKTRTRSLTDDDIREIIREAYPEAEAKAAATIPEKPANPKKNAEESNDKDVEADGAIEYFKDDTYNIPVDIKGKSKKVNFTLPVE